MHLKTEIMTYVSRSFHLNCKAASASQSSRADYKLPWEVLNDGGVMLSNIPLDVVMLLKGYFDLLGKADKPNISLQMRAGLSFLYQKIRVFQIESFILLIEKYRHVLVDHDWTTPKYPVAADGTENVSTPTPDNDEDAVFSAMGEHLLWLSSIGNDMIELQTRTNSFNNSQFPLSQELKAVRVSFNELSLSTLFIAMDCMSCIIYKSFDTILPLTNIYHKWLRDREEKNLTERIVGEVIWYLESNDEHLLPRCSWKLSLLCLEKFSMWYFSFLNECFTSKQKLTEDDMSHFAADCDYIYEHFSRTTQSKPSSVQVLPASSDSDEAMRTSYFCILKRFLQVKLMFTAPPGSPQLNELFADILKECDDFKDKAHALAQMIRVIFHLRQTATQQVYEQQRVEERDDKDKDEGDDDKDVNEDDDDDDDDYEGGPEQHEWLAMKIDMLTASIDSSAPSSTRQEQGDIQSKGMESSPEEWVWWASSSSSSSSSYKEGGTGAKTGTGAASSRLSTALVRSALLPREQEGGSNRRKSLLRY